MNATKDNGTTETIGKTLKDKKGDFMEISEDQDMLMEKIKAL